MFNWNTSGFSGRNAGRGSTAPSPPAAGNAPTADGPRAKIESLGVYLPDNFVSSQEVADGCVQLKRLPLERLTGIKTRPVALGEGSLQLASKAARLCLDLSSCGGDDIDLLIACNISHFETPLRAVLEPSLAARLKAALGLSNAAAFDIGNACAGFFTAMLVAESYLKAGAAQSVMVVSGEYISNLMTAAQRAVDSLSHPQLASLTVGDSGAAVVLQLTDSPGVGFHAAELFTHSEHSELCIGDASPRSDCLPAMHTQVAALQDAAITTCTPHVVETLDRQCWTGRVDAMIPHQTSAASVRTIGRRVNQALGKQRALPEDKYLCSADRFGNLATNAHLAGLWQFIRSGQVRSHDNVAFLIGASGLTFGTVLYGMDDLPDRINAFAGDEPPAAKQPAGEASVAAEAVTVPLKAPFANGRAVARAEILGVGCAGLDGSGDKPAADLLSLSQEAVEACLRASGSRYEDVDLLIFCGVYREKFLAEPAFAALLDGRIRESLGVRRGDRGMLAFDLLNGGVGFAQACQTAARMINSGQARRAVVAAAEADHARHGAAPRSPAGGAALIGPSTAWGQRLRVAACSLPGASEQAGTWVDFNQLPQVDSQPSPSMSELDDQSLLRMIRQQLQSARIDAAEVKVLLSAPESGRLAALLAEQLRIAPQQLIHQCDGQRTSLALPMAVAESAAKASAEDLLLHLHVSGELQAACTLFRAAPLLAGRGSQGAGAGRRARGEVGSHPAG